MSTNWTRVTVPFTDKEIEIIKQLQKKYNVSRAKAIRVLFTACLYFDKMKDIVADPNSPMFKTIKPLVDSFTTPEILKRIEQISDEGFSKVKPEVKHKAIQDFQTVQNELKKFTNHDPVGRKPSPKRPRGHPVDYGLDKPRSKKNPK